MSLFHTLNARIRLDRQEVVALPLRSEDEARPHCPVTDSSKAGASRAVEMMGLQLVWLAMLTTTLGVSEAWLCNFTKTTEKAPPEMLKMSTYGMSVRLVSDDKVMEMTETGIGEQITVSTLQLDQLVGKRSFLRLNGSKPLWSVDSNFVCSANASGNPNPYLFNSSIIKQSQQFNFTQFRDFIRLAQLVPKNQTREVSATIDGVAETTWIGCFLGTGEPALEISISYIDASKVKFASGVTGNIPTLIRIQPFTKHQKKKPDKITWSYSVSNVRAKLSSADVRLVSSPPLGVVCPLNGSESMPALPSSFAAEVAVWTTGRKDAGQLVVDEKAGLVGFDYVDGAREELMGWTQGVGAALKIANSSSPHFRVVLDAKAGLLMGAGGQGCLGPVNASGDLKGLLGAAPPDGRLLALHKPLRILLGAPVNLSAFHRQGSFLHDDGVNVTVFAADITATDSVLVFVSQAGFKQTGRWSNSSQPAITQVRRYRKDKTPAITELFRMHIAAFADFNTSGVPVDQLSVEPCLRRTNASYVYLTLNHKLEELEKLGLERVLSGLRSWMGGKMNASLLRLDSFYAKAETGKTAVLVVVGERATKVGVPSKMLKGRTEASLSAALKALNATLGGSDGPVVVGKDGKRVVLKTVAGSVWELPSALGAWGPSPPQEGGYSGGSMAVLALAMLLIGGAGGLVAAFFLWKRNRGIAYQVYE